MEVRKLMVEVLWDDALSQIHAEIGSPYPTCATRTIGYLEKVDSEYVIVMGSYNELGGCDRVIIPRGMVKRIVEVKRGKKWRIPQQ